MDILHWEENISFPTLPSVKSSTFFADNTNIDEAWDRLIASLKFAGDTAGYHDLEVASKRLKSPEAPWHRQLSNTSLPKFRGTGLHSEDEEPAGSPSESGNWINYAVYGAQAQELDDEGEDDELGRGTSPVIQTQSLKSDVKLGQLPAYCDPPNPCPIGYDPETFGGTCDLDIPNTKDFNRNWILQMIESGQCSCDEEHMDACPAPPNDRKDGLNYFQEVIIFDIPQRYC